MILSRHKKYIQTNISSFKKGEYEGFKIGDKVKLKRMPPDCILIITKFLNEGYAIMEGLENEKLFVGCTFSGLIKVDAI